MSTITGLLFALGLSKLTLIFVIPPPYFIPETRIPLAYAGDIIAALCIISLHIYVLFKILLLTSDTITIEPRDLLLFIMALCCLVYGYGYHAIAAPADLILNFGELTTNMTYAGEFIHYLHEYVSHKIQHIGLFLFYITILNLVEEKLIWYKSVYKKKDSDYDTEFLESYLQFLNPNFDFVSHLMSIFHGVLLGVFAAALDTNGVIILFCAYLMKRTIGMKGTIHKYLFYLSIASMVTLGVQNVLHKNIGISVLSDEGGDLYWQQWEIAPDWLNT